MDLWRHNTSAVNSSGMNGDTENWSQNFTFRDIITSDLFLPDVDPAESLDLEDSLVTPLVPGAEGNNAGGFTCNTSGICSRLNNSSLFVLTDQTHVVESSTRTFTDSDLWEENDYFALLNIPAMVFIGILMVFGIVGNLLVVYVYGFKFKPSTQHFLIVCLACLDLLMACIAMPTDIADLRFHHTFSSLAACKLLRFITMFSSTSSSFTLVTIAWDRHKRVTRPLTRQMTLRDAKIWECVNLVAACFFSWPLLVITGLRTSETRVHGLFGTDCSFSDSFHGTVWPLLYNSILGLGFAIMVVVLGTLYYQIWKRAKRHRIYMAKRMDRGPCSTTSAIDEAEGRAAGRSYGTTRIGKSPLSQDCVNVNDVNVNRATIPCSQPISMKENEPLCRTRDTNFNKAAIANCPQESPFTSKCEVRTNQGAAIDPLQAFPERLVDPKPVNLSLPTNQEDNAHPGTQENNLEFLLSREEKTSTLNQQQHDIPVFSGGVQDLSRHHMRSGSVISEHSFTEDRKNIVRPTISSNSFQITDESKCLLSKSQSLASLPKVFTRPKSPNSRRVSLPYISSSKTLRDSDKHRASQTFTTSVQRASNGVGTNEEFRTSFHSNSEGSSHAKCRNQREGRYFDELKIDMGYFFTLGQDLLGPFETDSDISQINVSPADGPASNSVNNAGDPGPEGKGNDSLTTHAIKDSPVKDSREGSQPEPSCTSDKNDNSGNACAQADTDNTNLNVVYLKNSSKIDISSFSSTAGKPINQRPLPCQSPTLLTEDGGHERFLSINFVSSGCMPASSLTKQNGNFKRRSRSIDKTTIVAFAVSIVFVVSFLPYLTLMFVRAFVEDFDYRLQEGVLWLYSCFLKFYLLNSAANPLLYGWLNERFRTEGKRLLCCGQRTKRVQE